VSANREEIGAGARQKHILIANPPKHHAAVLKIVHGNALAEVGSCGGVSVVHASLA
jgi:hypothetical protein